jgi:hypothetical protein
VHLPGLSLLLRNFNMEYCSQCEKQVETDFYSAPEHSPHYGKTTCRECRAFIGWVKKPKNEGKRTRSSKYKIDDFDITYCEICLRPIERLGRNEVLEIHHKIEVNEGGEDTKQNILIVCTACHKFINWIRLYFNKHFIPPGS